MKPNPTELHEDFSPCTSSRSFHSGGQSARNTPCMQQESQWQSHICLIPWINLHPPHWGEAQTFWTRHPESSAVWAERSAAWLQSAFTEGKPSAFFCWFTDIMLRRIINHKGVWFIMMQILSRFHDSDNAENILMKHRLYSAFIKCKETIKI